jgi:hypothetical protein
MKVTINGKLEYTTDWRFWVGYALIYPLTSWVCHLTEVEDWKAAVWGFIFGFAYIISAHWWGWWSFRGVKDEDN